MKFFVTFGRVQERFWALVEKTETCWIWKGNVSHYGYGRFGIDRAVLFAHRLAWEWHFGPIPPGSCVLHRCDNRRCVRGEHLFLGDRGDNARDMAAKGRQFLQQHPDRALRGADHPSRRSRDYFARGERHGHAALNEAAILDIRNRVAAGEPKTQLAREYETSQTNIGLIARGAAWTHVGGPRTPSKAYKKTRLGGDHGDSQAHPAGKVE